jgi:hypothetical protein
VTYKGQSYHEVDLRNVEIGRRVGTARELPCNDSDSVVANGTDKSEFDAFAIKGVETKFAIAAGLNRKESRFLARMIDGHLPPQVQELVDKQE